MNMDEVKVEEGFKRCSRCGEIKPLNGFKKNKDGKYGRYSICKECDKAYNTDYYANNKEKIKAYCAEYRDPHKNPLGWIKSMVQGYRHMDIERGFDDSKTITAEWFLENIAYQPCKYCGKQGIGKVGCNRIDNTKGHTDDNVVPCCTSCNCKENIRDQLARGVHISQLRKKQSFKEFVKEHKKR